MNLTPPLFPYRFFALLLSGITQTDIVSQPVPLMTVQLGENVLFSCLYSEQEVEYISWFKQTVGEKPRLIAISHKYTHPIYYGNFSHTRFKVLENGSNNQLIISNTEFSDSAIYYCGGMNNYAMTFATGTFLIVTVISRHKTVVQQPVSDPVHPGDSVTLQCTVNSETCAGDHSVYWFRHGSGESLPGLIYTHGNRSDECEKSPEAGSPTHSCVYSLPKRNLRRSDAGIYYCAVVTCGDILFGDGTKLLFRPTLDPVLLGLGAALVFCVVLLIFLVCYICKNTGKMSFSCKIYLLLCLH
uniref:Ig-like domain-containing protein n=1 Tax=Scleropages formosus TaxID=113540 RepID=A0A8C9THE1_SCLFO